MAVIKTGYNEWYGSIFGIPAKLLLSKGSLWGIADDNVVLFRADLGVEQLSSGEVAFALRSIEGNYWAEAKE